MTNPDELTELILDSLIDGAASFAVIHQQLASEGTNLDAVDLVTSIRELEEAGFVESWDVQEDGSILRGLTAEHWRAALSTYTSSLGTTRGHDVAYDEFGPWVELTERGRTKWQRSNVGEPTDDWSVRDLEERQIVVVEGKSHRDIEQALESWLAYRGDVEVVGDRLSTPPDFESRRASRGILRAFYKYELKPKS